MVVEFPIAGERYVSVAVVAAEWDITVPMVRVLFKNEPGTMRAPASDGAKPRMAFVTEAAIRRVYERHMGE